MGDSDGEASKPEGSSTDSDSVDVDRFHSLWVRWTDIGRNRISAEFDGAPIGDIHLHRFCDVVPRRSDGNPNEPAFAFVGGILRTGLRFTPLVILAVTAGVILYGEFSPTVQGVSALVPTVTPTAVAFAGGVVLLWFGILLLANRVDLIDGTDLLAALVVFGLIGLLSAGTIYSVYAVVTAENPASLPPNVVFLSGYLLMLLLGGLLVYDGMLKTEFLIEHFGTWERTIVPEDMQPRYADWKADLNADLSDRVFGIPTSHLFAVLFVLQFGIVWELHQGPQNLDSSVTLALNLVLDFFLVVVAFRFLVLVNYFHTLVTDGYDSDGNGVHDDTKIIRYEPFHADHHGGFKDFGRFATRVNVLLTLAGGYTIYRLFVQGLRVVPAAGIGAFDSFALVLWLGSYVVPILAYLVAAGAWLYYSFWAMHRKMTLEKQTLFRETTVDPERGGRVPAVGDRTDDFDRRPDWQYLRDAPEWPIKSRWLVSLASANVLPALFPIVEFF